MAMDWYGSHEADRARQVGNTTLTTGAEAGEAGRAVKQDADTVIARDEKNAWQEKRTLDRLLLVFLLLSVFLPLLAAGQRAAGRRPEPPWTPSTLAAISAAVAALLVAYRLVNAPGDDAQTTIKVGAPLALIVLVVLGYGAISAFQGETNWSDMRRAAAAAASAEPPPADDASN